MNSQYNASAGSYRLSSLDKGVVEAELADDAAAHKPQPEISFDDAKLEAYLSLYPAVGFESLTQEELLSAVEEAGIRYGLNNAALDRVATAHSEGWVQTDVLIAQGISPRDGRDAVVTLFFNNISKKPKVLSDGTVDYKNIDSVINVKKGDRLLAKRPPTPGVKGLTVLGQEIAPTPGKDMDVEYGDGVTANAAGTTFKAAIDGYVSQLKGRVYVNDVLVIDRDVDLSTGNIKFSGTVHVKGDVLSGFRVEGGKDIIVDGVAGDSELISKHNLILNGIKASGANNIFQADGDISVKFCENARLHAKHSIFIKKYAYNSELLAGFEIDATGGEGIIAGGELRAFQEMRVNQLGTNANINFTAYVGTKYYIDKRIEFLKRSAESLKEKLEEVGSVLDGLGEVLPRKDMEALNTLKDSHIELEELIQELLQKQQDLQLATLAEDPRIKVLDKVFGGVTLSFFGHVSTLREDERQAVFYYDTNIATVAWVDMKNAEND